MPLYSAIKWYHVTYENFVAYDFYFVLVESVLCNVSGCMHSSELVITIAPAANASNSQRTPH